MKGSEQLITPPAQFPHGLPLSCLVVSLPKDIEDMKDSEQLITPPAQFPHGLPLSCLVVSPPKDIEGHEG